MDKMPPRFPLKAGRRISPTLLSVKARWGRDGGLGGKGNTARARRGVPLPPKQAANSVNTPYAGQRRLLMSRCGGSPNMRLYSRVNWVTLS